MPIEIRPAIARLFHLADLVAGHAKGNPCPSCSARRRARLVRKHAGLGSIYRCLGCGLLFRPTGLQSTQVARWYYSAIYDTPGVETDVRVEDRASVLERAGDSGKDRSRVLERVLRALPEERRQIGVLGASWGYELISFERLRVPVWGIEPGDARREHGRREFGLQIHPSIQDAARRVDKGGILFSSHVLEHITTLSAALDEADALIGPTVHVHITPRVDPPDGRINNIIGREHPLGVTQDFFRRRAEARGQVARFEMFRPAPDEPVCELLTLVADASIDLAAIDLDGTGVA